MRASYARHVLIAVGIALLMASPTEAAGPPFELTVRKDHFVGSSQGTLVFTEDGAEYRTTDRDDARRWTYQDIKQVQVRSPKQIAILTYEDRGRLKFGADRTFEFEIVQGDVAPELVAFLLERIRRPVVTSVLPRTTGVGTPLFRVPVKHQRARRSSEGTLVLFEDRLVYLTERDTEARYWRIADLYSVLRVDRYRLEVVVYEGGSGNTRGFIFELKEDLPAAAYEALWVRVNPPTYELRRDQAGRVVEPPR